MATASIVTAATGRHVIGAPMRFVSPSPVGLWYGKKSSSSCSPTTDQVIHIYRVNNIQKMWLCCDTPHDGRDILHKINSDGEANIQVVLHIPTAEVRKIAETPLPPVAIEWINLIVDNQPVINYVCLGDVNQMNNNDITMIGTAMNRIVSNNLISSKVSTILDVNIIFGSYDPTKCPSSYKFLDRFKKVLREVFNRLGETSAPLFVKIFPYFAILDCIVQGRIGLDNYLLEQCADPYMSCDQLNYRYVFDAMVDSISYAMNDLHFSNVDISVVSGWPTAGSNEAKIEYAKKYNNHLLRHINEDTPRKTRRIDHFIFTLVDEDLLTPPNDDDAWRHFGTFTPWKKETFPPTEIRGSAEAT